MLKLFSILSALLVSNWFVFAGTALADMETDFEQPIRIEADHEELDLRADVLVFSGNVIITQGSLVIRASQLNVESIEQNGESNEVFIATGAPAYYQQNIETGLLVEAEAQEIRYESEQRILTLHGSAQMRQAGNQVNASRIVYYVDEQRVIAERAEDSEERVTTIFEPRTGGQRENDNNGNP